MLRSWGEAADLLRARSTDLEIAAADLERAEADSRGALASLLGSIRVDGAYTFNLLTTRTAEISGISAGNPVFTAITLPQPSFASGAVTATLPLVAPRAWVAVKASGLREDAARADVSDVQRRLRESLAATILGVVAAERTGQLSRESLAAAIDRAALVTRKKVLGGGTVLDEVRGQQDLEAARAQVVSADESVHRAREALGLALGLKEEVGIDPVLRLDDAVHDVAALCKPVPSLLDRPDIAASAIRVDVAHQVVRDADAQLLPTVSVQSVLTPSTQKLDPYPDTQWYVAGLVSWNLWDGGSRYADRRRGEAQERAARARLEQAVRAATVEVGRALRGVGVAEDARAVAEQETAFAARQEALTKQAYEIGQGTSLELVAAAAGHRAQQIGLVLKDYELVRARLTALFVRSTCKL